jgi:hypothetical protein
MRRETRSADSTAGGQINALAVREGFEGPVVQSTASEVAASVGGPASVAVGLPLSTAGPEEGPVDAWPVGGM